MRVELYYDLVCPYAWMASTQVEALAARYGAELVWKPVLLGGVFKAVEAPQVPAASWSTARAAQIAQDLARQARALGLPLRMHPRHPVRSVDAMRLLISAPEAALPAMSAELYRAYFVENKDIDDMSVLSEIAARHGAHFSGEHPPEVKQALFDQTAEAVARGVFGVPAIFVSDGDRPVGWWWGQDRLHLVERALGGPPTHAEAGGFTGGSTGPATGGEVELFHDLASPFSYLAATQLPALCAARGAALRWTPILLGALFRDIGTPDVPLFAMSEPKRRYVLRDLEEWAAWWGVPFRFPEVFPVRTVLPLRVALQAPAATAPLYAALWAEGRDVGRPEVVREVLLDAGLDAEGLIEGAQDPAVKQHLKDNTSRAAALGVCGVPSARVNGGPILWGQDRLGLVEAALEGRL